MNIGLYFGTFNPIHIGHLVIANYIAEQTDLDEVWFVVTPQNPLKNKISLLKDRVRERYGYIDLRSFNENFQHSCSAIFNQCEFEYRRSGLTEDPASFS